MLGPDLEDVQGKTARHKSDRGETYLTPIPRDFYEIHKFINLTTDVLFVN